MLTTEHVDAIDVGFDGERLTVDSTISPPVEHVATDDLVFHLTDLARVEELPEQYAEFIGADTAWVVMQTQNPDVLWAGWSTEQIGAGVVDGDAVDITLTDVRGPGELEVFQTGPFGEPIRIFSSDEDHATLRQAVNAHVHANWAFTQPGVYTLGFTVSAVVDGRPVTTGPVDYTWVVGGDEGTLPEPGRTSITLDAPARTVAGDEVVLTADVAAETGADAPPAPGGYVEFHDGDTSLGWTGLTDGRATLPVTFDEPGEHRISATYSSQEPQFFAGSTSEPVTVVVEDTGEEPVAPTLTVTGPDAVTAGDDVTLTATQDPPSDLRGYRWSTRSPGAMEFRPIDGATTETVSITAAAADDGRQYRVALYTDGGEYVAQSAPHTLTVSSQDPGEDPPGQCEDPRTVLTDEHVDLLSPSLDGDALGLRARVGTASDHAFHDPADLVVQVKDPEAAIAVPPGADYEFLGAAGDPLWMIPQTQNPQVVWAGWSTEELAPGALRGDGVELTLVRAEGPGEVEVFQTAGLGAAPTRIFSSTDALPPRQQSVGQHVHANWAFTALGDYTLTFEVSGSLPDGTAVTTGEVDYAVVVGDLECDPGLPGDESGTDAGGDTSGGDAGGGDAGGGDGGADGGGADGGGTDGGDAGGGDDGTGPSPTPSPTPEPTTRPTTKPTGEVCVPTNRPSGTPGGQSSGDPVVLTNEHVDLLAPVLESGRLDLRAKVGTAADHTFHDPADVLVQVVPAAESTVPGGDAYGFLGTAGSPLWLIPETQNPEVVWAGWSTEELASGTFAGDAVDMRLVGAEGPGTVEVFQTTGFGDIARIFSSEESLPLRQQSVGQHVHANWAFSAKGSYTLTFEVSGTAGGEAVTTGPVEYSFVVGELSGVRNATPTPSPTATPTAGPSPSSTADCDLASTGTSSTPALTVLGGLLVAGGAVALAAHWRERRAARA
ncbi:choice-of-anchor M domain-containing protein [Jiangella mangrovi]|uniref:Surface-anchored protein/LPXTG-motif cell wall-anchored protein n=1 Tax=Jiangella mangrovi TaxID=1524084 RepID=A0A7W9GRN6_9ACTN|nr:surface-anchored protein/LPXTG-motif cell wall-anchored protein [Jiangella mangrovi]